MNKCAIFLLITVLLIGLTVVSAEEITQDTSDTTTVTTTQTNTPTQPTQTNTQQNIQKEHSAKNIETTKQNEVTNNSHQLQKPIHNSLKNIKSASPSEELSTIELSTKTKLENAFAQAKIEIDNAQSTYEKEQIPESVKKIVKQITDEAARAETIYNASQDKTLLPVITNIRNHAGYADLLINPQKLTDPVLAEKYKTRPLDRKNGKYDLLTIVAQKLKNTQESVYINLTSDEFQNLYNDVGEIHHPGEYDRYGHVQLVNKTNFVQVTNEPENFELIPFPLARIYLEGFYNKGVYYTYTFASSANGTGWYHVDGSTLTKARYMNYTTNDIVYGNSGIVFWKMLKTNDPNLKYVLTDERYYPDLDGHPPDNMPKENNDDNGIYFVGYVIKTETGGIHIDGVIVEYRVPEQTYDVNFTAKKVWNDSNNQDGLRTNTVTIQLLADGERYGDNIVLYEGNNWTYNYVNLPRYNKDNNETIYTIVELNTPTGYKASINNYVVTNTHIPETKDIEVFKEWNDDNNRDGIRPKSITVDLYANNALKQTVVINNTNWRYTFRNLPVYNNGNKINYTVRERNVNRYTTNIRNINNEYIITNTYIPATRNITVNKNWNDNNNQDGIRPTSITVQLLKDETPYQNPIRLTRDNHWTYTFRNLPVNENGNPITYRIIETAIPEGYTVTNNGLTITNTHIPETKDIQVLKEWDDDHNRDGIRPSQVTVNLLADGEVINTVTLNTANSWRHEFENLDVYSNGRKINYTVQEIRVNNYTTSITEVNNEFIILNRHVPLVKEVNVIKVWDDHDNEHQLRPDSVQVQLFADGEKYGETTTLTSNGNWRHTFTNLPVNFDGKEIIYVVKEVILPEEYYNTINVTGNTVTITNIFDPEHAHVKVIKEWEDNHDSDKLRPTSVQVQLYANGEKQGNPVTLNQANYWRHSFDNLLKYVNNEEVNYTVQEVTPVTGYTSEVKTLTKNEYAIVNKHNPETINITINKVWEDDNNRDGIRPNNIQIVLLSDGEVYESRTLSERNGWKYTFTNLNKNFDGKEIVYTVAEIGLTPGYITTYDGFTITNKHTPETIELHVVKEWIANYNQDGIRPETIQVQLNKNGIATQNVTLSDNNNWTHIFKNLPKYENGEEISYTITETPVPQYTTTVTNENNKVIIRNVHIPETINITINKVWKDNNNQDGIRPDRIRVALLRNGEEIDRVTLSENNSWKYTFKDLDKNYNGKPIKYTIDEIGIPTGYKVQYNGYTITNIHTPETMDVIVIVEWDDLDDIDEIRPENVTITLYKNDEPIKNISISPDDDWRTIFEDLPIYENGTPINYTADEILPNGYTRTIEINGNEIIITNIHRPEEINITVKKVWDDDNNRDKLRPELITIQLLANGEEYRTVTLRAIDLWEYPFTNLPKTKKGVDIVYTIKELDNIKNYTTKINGYTITNVHTPETVDVKVNVEWDDLDDQDGIRPENVTIILYKDDEPIKNVTITPDDDWKTIFEDLPKYENGTPINYTADEILPDGYTRTIEIGDNEINITNIHRPETIDVKVDIVWDDLDDQDGIRPDTVTVILYENGKQIKDVVVTKDNWSTIFDNLPKYKDGKLIKYTVDEVLPDGYTRTITADGNHFTITNIHRPETIDVKVDIVWDDLDNQDGIRPDTVTVILYENGKQIKDVVVTKDNWSTIFDNLPKYKDGKLIKYTVDEVLPDGYTRTITADGNHFTITNIHRPETIDVPVRIEWDDLEDIDGIRPDTVTLVLYADGKEVKKITVSPDDDWNIIFDNLPKYDNGKLIKYTVDEITPNGYTKTITEEDGGFVITNVHRPQLVWTWKLVEIIPENKPIDRPDNPSDDRPVRINGYRYSSYNTWNVQSRYYKYSRYNGYRYNWYRSSGYRYNRYNGHGHSIPLFTKYLYRLYIQLYNEYLSGKISFADFIVILSKEGLDPEIVHFNENGTITIDYEDLEDVPDSITVEYKNDDIPSTSDDINTTNPDNYDKPVIDAGEVKVPSSTQHSNNGDSSSNVASINSASSSSSGSNNAGSSAPSISQSSADVEE